MGRGHGAAVAPPIKLGGWGLTLDVSTDGHAWTTVRTARGTGQLTTLKVPHNRIRYVRATLTQDAAQPWTIAEVRVHR